MRRTHKVPGKEQMPPSRPFSQVSNVGFEMRVPVETAVAIVCVLSPLLKRPP